MTQSPKYGISWITLSENRKSMKLVKTKVFSKVIGEKCHENRLLIYLFTFLRGYIYLFRASKITSR